MGEQVVRTSQLEEGEVFGSEVNASNGRRYTYRGHYLGNGTIVYRASICNWNDEYRGEVSGVFTYVSGQPLKPKDQVQALLRSGVKNGVGYRP